MAGFQARPDVIEAGERVVFWFVSRQPAHAISFAGKRVSVRHLAQPAGTHH
jgi:hypothetical protein